MFTSSLGRPRKPRTRRSSAQIPAPPSPVVKGSTSNGAIRNLNAFWKNAKTRRSSWRRRPDIEDMTRKLEEYRRLLNPVRKLSAEILKMIFVHLRDSADITDSLGLSFAPWTVSRVSRKWRAVALSSPVLWANLGVAFYESLSSLWQNYKLFLLMGYYLSQSNNLPLDVTISSDFHPIGTYMLVMPLLMSSSAMRWKSLFHSLEFLEIDYPFIDWDHLDPPPQYDVFRYVTTLESTSVAPTMDMAALKSSRNVRQCHPVATREV